MADSPPRPAPAALPDPHVTIRPDRPVEVRFSFERSQPRVGVAASVGSHIVLALIAVLVLRYQPEPAPAAQEDRIPAEIVWLPEPGPGGGGGGGGNKNPNPPRKAELPGREKLTVPVMKTPDLTPEPPKPEPPPPPEELMIPAKTMAAAEVALPGVITNQAPVTESLGSGTGGGGGTGTGTGAGSGTGPGLGSGVGGGCCEGAYRPGGGVSNPVLLKEVRPAYTANAMRAKVQGEVWVECIVLADGSVGSARIIRSLDTVFGLDDEALKAARQWRFRPGMRLGEPVPVLIQIALSFNLR